MSKIDSILPSIPLGVIIDTLPENLPLYKDSGLWQIRSDDMEEVVFQQTTEEDFPDFIRRYATHLLETDDIFPQDLAFRSTGFKNTLRRYPFRKIE